MNPKILPYLVLAATLFAAPEMVGGDKTPKREFRSTWFTTHVNIDWPQKRGTSASVVAQQKADMIAYIEGFERMNLNGACFQVRAQCDAVYKSSYEPWSAVLSGTRGTDPGWDPLQFCIDECHKRGLECYAWINPFRWSTGTDYNTPQDKEFKQKGWILKYGTYHVLNPAIPEARAHIIKVCKEIVDNYRIDGVLFDDYFYPNNIPENSEAGDWELYRKSGTSMSIGDWRRENINIFVREFQAMIEESHPDMRFGISPAGVAGKSAAKFGVDPCPINSDWQYNTIYSDPLAWLHDGSIDFISPQIYWTTNHATAPYEPLCKWWTYVADHFGRHFYSSHNVYFLYEQNQNNTGGWNEVATQVRMNRNYAAPTDLNAPGSIYYSSKYFYGPAITGLGDHLLANTNQTKSLVPIVTWKKVPALGTPENLKLSGSTLSWKAIEAPKSNVRYTVYAVPDNVSIDDATESNGDGISNDYLLRVCYENTFTLPSGLTKGYWYAVCAYDGLGNEYAPAVVNYPDAASAKVTLTSPANNATITWTQTFAWSSASDATYVLTIASDANFSNIVYKSDALTTTSARPDLSVLKPQATYYWNVTCTQKGKFGTVSDNRIFRTPAYTAAPKVALLSPADGVDIEEDTEFKWQTDASLSSYTFEVSDNADFSRLKYSLETTAGAVTLTPSKLGLGKFFWRVKGSGQFMNPSYSATRSFTISHLDVGAYEPGYSQMTDGSTSVTANNITMENLWIRSRDARFGNIDLSDDGTLERSMVAVGNFVYMTRRSENAQGAKLYLDKYSGDTGELMGVVEVSQDACVPLYPLNTVVKDDNDNVVIGNLTTNVTVNPLVLHAVDLETGDVTPLASLTPSGLEKTRIDHFAVKGDVVKGDFTVYAVMASSNAIIRADYVAGAQTELKTVVFKDFSPASASSFGIAANITPVTRDLVLVNGGGADLGLYNLSTGKREDYIGTNTAYRSFANSTNGSGRFTLNKKVLTVNSILEDNVFSFHLMAGDNEKLAEAKPVAKFPNQGMGKLGTSTCSTPVSTVKNDDSSANLYVFVAGNGLAAYRVKYDDPSGVTDLVTDNDLSISVVGGTVVLNRKAGSVRVYSISGALVASARNADSVQIGLAGIYIVVADGVSERVIVK